MCKTSIPKNVQINTHLKPTLDNDSFKLLLNKDKAIEYFQFLENFSVLARESNNKQLNMELTVPNMAVPAPHTKEDGIKFRDLLNLLREISEENKTKHYFKLYNDVMLFMPRDKDNYFNIENKNNYCHPGYICSSGNGMVGLLPNNLISECHMAFVDTLGEYKDYSDKNKVGKDSVVDFALFTKTQPIQMTIDIDSLDLYENKVQCFNRKNTTFRVATLVS